MPKTNQGYTVEKLVEKASKRELSYEEYAAYVKQHQESKNERRRKQRERYLKQIEKTKQQGQKKGD